TTCHLNWSLYWFLIETPRRLDWVSNFRGAVHYMGAHQHGHGEYATCDDNALDDAQGIVDDAQCPEQGAA
ncbi:hypothetical protein, partial [Chromohalobacter marismortui]|uniref:hypothetical protein n=1 Tax=Chromohalobacter marismortui TaxID=42055 RepID=UPI001AB00890